MKKLNLPNKLTVLRIFLVPLYMAVLMLPESVIPYIWSGIIGAILFTLTALTDMLDGKLARKYGLITDFGKFLDPLADKFAVIGAMLVLFYRVENIRAVFLWALVIVIFRELAVTSLRLIVSGSSGVVVAAGILGKIKTVMQMVFVITTLVEPVLTQYLYPDFILNTVGGIPLTYLSMFLMTLFTVLSAVDYFKGYWKYIDPTK